MRRIIDLKDVQVDKYYLNGNFNLTEYPERYIRPDISYCICSGVKSTKYLEPLVGYRIIEGFLPHLIETSSAGMLWYVGKDTPLWELSDSEVIEHVLLETI